MTLSALAALFRLERQGLLYLADGAHGSVLEEDGSWPLLALAAPGAVIVGGPALAQAVRLPSGASAANAWGLPTAGQPRRIELVLRLPDAPIGIVELVGWGQGTHRIALDYAPTSGMLRANVGAGVAMQVAVSLSNGAFHQVGMELGSDGSFALLVDGTFFEASSAVPLPEEDIAPVLRILTGVAATAELAACAVAPALFDRARVGERADVLAGAWVISGHAALDGGPAAELVIVRDVIGRNTLAKVAPNEDRTFAIPVPPGLYEVLCVGPDGYLAQVIDQVAAEPIA